MNKSIAILGCSSSVGKTSITTALCRYYSNFYNVSPFKAFNLSSESFEMNNFTIGYAQYIQSLAAKKSYSQYMNPILVSYENNKAHIYINGMTSHNYSSEDSIKIIDDAYENIKTNSDLIFVEGSGSAIELNMKNDFANMHFATRHNTPIILVADISKGGVFGTLLGHLMLMNKEERELVVGIIINKFDGEANLFSEGSKIIEEICNTKVIGVIPTLEFNLPHEDTVSNEEMTDTEIENNIEILTDHVIKNIDIDYLNNIIKKQ